MPRRRHLSPWVWVGTALLVAVAATALLFDWNWLQRPLERQATAALGRPITIDGLDVDLGRTTVIRATGVRVANPDWASRPEMMRAEAMAVGVRLLPLLRGNIELPFVTLDAPDLRLEKGPGGAINWRFGNSGTGGTPPRIGRLDVTDGRIGYHDPATETDLDAGIATVDDTVRIQGGGRYRGRTARITLLGGALLSLRPGGEPYPVDLEAGIGETHAAAKGTLADPLTLQGLDLDLRVKGPDMAEIFPIFGIPAPHTRPYTLEGHLIRSDGNWTFRDFKGVVGESDLSGGLTVVTGGTRALLRANLHSDRLALADLAGLIGGDPGGEDITKGPERVLPDRPVAMERLTAMDMDVRLAGKRVEAPGLPMDALDMRVVIEEGRVRLDPLAFAIAQGSFAGTLVLDGTRPVPQARVDMDIRRMDLARFLAGTPFADESSGTLAGRVELAGRGASTAELLGSSNGRVTLLMASGSLSALLIEAMGIDIAEALGFALGEDKAVPVRCLVADFAVQGGTAQAQALVLDTTDSVVTGAGTIDLGNEALDLRLEAQPKDPSPFSARSPVLIRGRLGKPQFGLQAEEQVARGGIAAALGALLGPLGALIPFLEPGLGEDQPCNQLISRAKTGQ